MNNSVDEEASADAQPADWRPTASLEVLKQRAVLLDAMRRVFHDAGYWEVETPILSADIIVDAHLDPFVAQCSPGPLPGDLKTGGRELFLQTSPEFAMKRLLAAGADAIYQIGRVFRNGEQGERHNPEFTMAEWYRAGIDHHAQMDFTEQLVRAIFSAAESFRSGSAFDKAPFERMTYNEAFERFAGCEVLELDANELRDLTETHELSPPESLAADDRDGLLNFLLAEVVEPELGFDRPVFLYDYPASQAALAKIRNDDLPVAERFELYISGVEICNGYHELTDPEEFARRMQTQNALRRSENARPLPESNRLLEAMRAGLPASSGVALGVDRLVMLALGKSDLSEVIAFPFERA